MEATVELYLNKEPIILSILSTKIGDERVMVPDSQSELEKRLEGMPLPAQLKLVIEGLRELEKAIEELEKRINFLEVEAPEKDG